MMDNKRKPPGYWTTDRCLEVAAECGTKSEFIKKYRGAYDSARKKGILNMVCAEMVVKNKPKSYWEIKENCEKESLKYDNRTDFSLKSRSAYDSSKKNGWIDEVCSHMKNEKIEYPPKKEKCLEKALECKNRTEFSKKYWVFYKYAKENDWLDEICLHMNQKPRKYWNNIEVCKKEAIKYRNRGDFLRGNRQAYESSRKNGWLDEVCSHMIETKKPPGYWNIKENCKKEALKYKTRSELQKNSSRCYKSIHSNGWVEEMCSHMEILSKPNGYWTKNICEEEAKNYNSRKEFRSNNPQCYQASYKHGWLDEICDHMIPLGSLKDRYVYAYEFPNTNSVYIGLTFNIKKRQKQHISGRKKTKVYLHINNNSFKESDYNFKVLGYFDQKEASNKEGEYLKYYISMGWNILNVSKTGGLGGDYIRWNIDKCNKLSKKCKTKSEFRKKYANAYNACYRHGWLDEVCSHMTETRKPTGYWDIKENCKKEALKYKTRAEFWESNGSACNRISKNGWMDEVCSHMKGHRKPFGYWTKERCRVESLKYKTKQEFRQKCVSAYSKSLKNDWLRYFFP